MRSYDFLFWAYNIIWLAVAGYILMTFLRVRRVETRITALEREMNRKDS